MKNKLTEKRKQQIWEEIMLNPTYSRNVNRNKLQKNNKSNRNGETSERLSGLAKNTKKRNN